MSDLPPLEMLVCLVAGAIVGIPSARWVSRQMRRFDQWLWTKAGLPETPWDNE